MQEKVKQQMQRILEYISAGEFVSVQNIMDEYGMSKSTVNRYLQNLEKEKKISRMYGGVSVYREEKEPEPDHKPRSPEALEAIGRRAAALVEDRDIIFVGTGRTCFELYRHIEGRDIIVFTNSIYCAGYRNPSVAHIYMLGGEVFDSNVVLGSLGIENLMRINPGKIFFSASAVNYRFEIQYNYDMERQYIEALMQMEGKKFFLVNSAKQELKAPFKISCLSSLDAVVTDITADEEQKALLRESGTEIIQIT